jgi:hypothetical protein
MCQCINVCTKILKGETLNILRGLVLVKQRGRILDVCIWYTYVDARPPLNC